MDNPLFQNQADACLHKFEQLVQSTGQALSGQLREKTDSSQGQQAKKFSASAAGYSLSLDKLDALIALDRKSIQQMQDYLASLNFPVDDRDAMQKPCYGDAYRAVDADRRRFED